MPDWFFVESGKAVGPLSRIELEAHVRAGRVTPDTLVCEDGAQDWRLARRVPGLVPPKLMKAWQAGVAAEARASQAQEAASPRRPYEPPAAESAPQPPGAAPTVSGAAAPAAAGLRKHLVLVLTIAVAAAGGGLLGAWLVVRQLAPALGPEAEGPAPAALAAGSGAVAAPADPASPAAPDPTVPRGLRPALPSAPPPLPEGAQRLLDARWAPVREKLVAQDAASEALASSGGLDASTLSSREAIDARLAALSELRSQNEALRRALSELPEAVRADATAEGLPPEVADAAARRAKADASREMEACDADAELHDIAGEVLGLLGESFGQWSVATGSRQIEFKPEAADARTRYADLVRQAEEVVR